MYSNLIKINPIPIVHPQVLHYSNIPRLKKPIFCGARQTDMESATILPLESGSFWISIIIVAAIVAAVSAFFQMQAADGKESTFEPKTLARDGLLGAIVGALGWVLVPESMAHMTASIGSGEGVTATTSAIATLGEHASKSVHWAEPELHLGNPDF
jgi:hypothetical protein